MADVGLVRKRLKSAIEAARRAAATRRERASVATRAYEQFLETVAVPALRTLVNAMRAEGILFELMTPAGGARLTADRNRDDVIALELDTTRDPPHPQLIVTQIRGSRVLRTERPIKDGSRIDEITEDDLIELLLEELKPWLA